MKIRREKRAGGIYRKVILCFSVILAVLLVSIGVIINGFCMSFIKEQRLTYNTQVLEKIDFEFKELYLQMNQFLSSLYDTTYENRNWETTFQRIKRELEFEEGIQNMIYMNVFQNFCEGVLFYDSEEQFYYVGKGTASEEYSFVKDPQFRKMAAGMFQCVVTGPMEEPYRPKNVKKNNVIGFLRRKVGTQVEGSLPPFVMAAVNFEKVEETLNTFLSSNIGFALMDGQGEILHSQSLSEIDWEGTLEGARDTILNNPDTIQTFSQNGILLSSIRIEGYDWILTVADAEKILFQDITNLTRLVELLIGICGIAGVLTAVFFAKRILFPIEVLKNLVDEIGKDDKTYLEEASNDEMGKVQVLLNSMKKKIQDLNARQYILEVRQREAEIRMLQSQMNPHFLHNTLDNIYCIAQIEEIDPIVSLTRNLSDMLRYSVSNKSMYTSLREEMNHVRAYVEILNIRYEDSIHLEADIPSELEDALVVKLLVQPIVENACIHGILPRPEQKGSVRVTAKKNGGNLEICVEDDGVGISEELREQMNHMMRQEVRSVRTPKNKGFGIAMVNVNDRIRLLDGPKYGIRIEARPMGGTRIVVTQKYRTEEIEKIGNDASI